MSARGTLAPPPASILFIRLWGLGDVLLSTPAVHAVRTAYPCARITYATAAAGADALRGNPDLDDVIVIRRGVRPMLRALRDVRRRRFDAVVDLHSTARTAYLVGASGARRRVGFLGRGPRGALYTHATPRRNLGEYAPLELLRLLSLIGVSVGAEPDLRLRIACGVEERGWAADVWRRYRLEGATVVAAAPVSLMPYKQWGAARWAAVADRLEERGVRVLLTHGPRERAQAAAVVAHMRHAPVWDIEVPGVRHLAALYERCTLWLGNDGGGKHVAVAAGVPTVTVSRYTMGAPWTDTRPGRRHWFIERPPPRPCDFRCSRCAHRGCLSAVAVADVDELVRAVLAGAATPPPARLVDLERADQLTR